MSCERCGGFKVYDYFYGPSTCEGFRCINCGAITDMRMILVRPPERMIQTAAKDIPLTAPDIRPAQ
jgi:hypothetical protein